MKFLIASFTAWLSLVCLIANGQGEIPVDMHTGTPSIFIPTGGVSSHDLSDGVGISYNARGLKLEENTGQLCGAGWAFQAGGMISREVRGLPDDFLGQSADTRKGWLYSTMANDAANFSTSADTLASTCSDENSINSTLNNYNFKNDTEPDIFYFSAGGISGAFVFDNNQTIRLIPYQDVKIEYTFNAPPSDKKIISFKITANNGVVYTFDNKVYMTRRAHKLTSETQEFLQKDFKYYDYDSYSGGLTFASEWKLSRIESPSGAFLKYNYTTQNYAGSDTIKLGIRSNNSSALVSKKFYRLVNSGSRKTVRSIVSSEGDSLVIEGDPVDRVVLYDRRRNPSYIKEFLFQYQSFGVLTEGTQRTFLKSITEQSGCDQVPAYEFTYINVDYVNGTCALPPVFSSSKDFWGYYNGKSNSHAYPTIYVYPSEPLSQRFRVHAIPGYGGIQYTLPGADRTPDPIKMQIGSLESIKYPTGGVATFNYEANDFFDSRTSTNLIGGGLRIKSIVYFDGINVQGKIVKNFEYKAGSNSSGRVITLPSFVIPSKQHKNPEGSNITTYAQLSLDQERYEYLIVRSDRDLTQSFDRDGVGYTNVKVSRPGAGSTEYDFAMPAVYGNGTSGDWIATSNKFVRPSGCLSMDIVSSGGRWSFGYAPNPNFDYERGFVLKRTDRSSTGTKVREVSYTPQYIYKSGTTPFKVWGVSYEHFPMSTDVFFYGKYFILTDVAKAPSLETEINYDANDVSKYVTTSSQQFYESTYHKLLTRTVSTGSDGSIVTAKIKYPLDYGTFGLNMDESIKGLKNLQNAYRISVPVEVITSIQRTGDVEKVIGANLTTFADFGISGKAFPVAQYSLSIDQGITDFVPSSRVLDGINHLFNYDSRYQTVASFLQYGTYGNLISSIGTSRIPVTTVMGYDQSIPVVQASNVLVNQFAFSNFETDADSVKTGYEFQHNLPSYGTGRTGRYSFTLFPSAYPLTKTLSKAGVSKYKLSFWLRKITSAAIDINIKLKNASNTEVYSKTITLNPASNNFEYFEEWVPITSVSSSTFTIIIQGVNMLPGGYPNLDDIAFYPENADLLSYTHNFPIGTNSITDATGSTAFVVHDGLGREQFVKDQDGNILRKTTYKFSNVQAPAFTASIIAPSQVIEDSQVSFTANENSCINSSDVTYEWDFGSGFQNLGIVAAHTFTVPGNYLVTLKKTHPYYGTVTVTRTISVVAYVPVPVFTVEMCAKGAEEINCTTVTSSYSCASITGTPSGQNTIFQHTNSYLSTGPLPAGETISTITWYRSIDDGLTWTNIGTGTTITLTGSPGVTTTVRCHVATSAGRTAYSNELTITKTLCN